MTRISEAILLFLVNAAWQSALVALLVSVSDRVLRKAAARYRHVLWVGALVSCIVLSLSSALRLAPATASFPSPASVDLDANSPRERTAAQPLPAHTARTPSVSRGSLLPQSVMPIVALRKPLALALVALYGLLLLYRIGTLLKAWGRTRSLLRSARVVELPGPVAQALARCRRVLGIGNVTILSSATAIVPATAGTTRPVLILPEQLFSKCDVQLLTSALGHEAAHIARRDYLLNLVYEFVSLPLWFHPAMRLVLRRVRQTRELCCDEIVTERLLEPRVYAQSLVQLAGAALPFGRPAATITVGIADADILEERIMSILKYSPARLRRRNALLLVAALLLVVPCIAAAQFTVHVAIHQPATAVALEQNSAKVVKVSQSTEAQKTPPQTIKLLTKDGEVTVTTDNPPKVGDVISADHHRWKIVSINPEGQYTAYTFKNATGPASGEEAKAQYKTYVFKDPGSGAENGGTVVVNNKGYAYAEQDHGSSAERRDFVERAVREGVEGQISEQEALARRKQERVEEAAQAQRQIELARQAKITMDQAIQTALHDSPGTVTEARLVGERGVPTYIIVILQQNGTENTTARLLINAMDGSIMTSNKWGQER
jgi:beta-lactamase regulating signal transducer with metallopeptidase domain/uncharacterized membrane protein YkoI